MTIFWQKYTDFTQLTIKFVSYSDDKFPPPQRSQLVYSPTNSTFPHSQPVPELLKHRCIIPNSAHISFCSITVLGDGKQATWYFVNFGLIHLCTAVTSCRIFQSLIVEISLGTKADHLSQLNII